MKVLTPISADLRAYALANSPTPPPEVLATVEGQEHLLMEEGLMAQVAHMLDAASISPSTITQLLTVAETIHTSLATLPPDVAPEMLATLRPYLDALTLVRHVAVFQSGFVIASVKHHMVDVPMAEKLGVLVENVKLTVDLLKLARRHGDGTPWNSGEEWHA